MQKHKKSKFSVYFIAIFIFINFTYLNVYAHPGSYKDGTNCHICRTNCDKWGYSYNTSHCHTDTIQKFISPDNRSKSEITSKSKVVIEKKNENAFLYTALILLSPIPLVFISLLYLKFSKQKNKK